MCVNSCLEERTEMRKQMWFSLGRRGIEIYLHDETDYRLNRDSFPWDLGGWVSLYGQCKGIFKIHKHTYTHVYTSIFILKLLNKHPGQRQQSLQPHKSSKINTCIHSTIHLYCLRWSQLWPPALVHPILASPPGLTARWVMSVYVHTRIFECMCALYGREETTGWGFLKA